MLLEAKSSAVMWNKNKKADRASQLQGVRKSRWELKIMNRSLGE